MKITRTIMGLPAAAVADESEPLECARCGSLTGDCDCEAQEDEELTAEDWASIKGDMQFHLLRDEGEI